jgi:hypothetical protein
MYSVPTVYGENFVVKSWLQIDEKYVEVNVCAVPSMVRSAEDCLTLRSHRRLVDGELASILDSGRAQ